MHVFVNGVVFDTEKLSHIFIEWKLSAIAKKKHQILADTMEQNKQTKAKSLFRKHKITIC